MDFLFKAEYLNRLNNQFSPHKKLCYNDFEVLCLLGKGGYGEVYKVKLKTN